MVKRLTLLAILGFSIGCSTKDVLDSEHSYPSRENRVTKELVLHKWSQSLGGLDVLQRIRSVYFLASFETGGLRGTYEEWVAMDGQRRCQLDLGDGLIQQVDTFDGQRGWQCDLGKRPVELAGAELRREINQVFQATYSHLISGRIPAQVEFLGEDSDPNHFVIRTSPKGGSTITWYLNKTSFLPVRFEEPYAERTRSTVLDDWHVVGGVKFPYMIRKSTGDPKYDIVLRIDKVLLDVPLADIGFGRPPDPLPDWEFQTDNNSKAIPFELISNHIYLQARINDLHQPLWFLLDSGAAATVINTSTATKLNLQFKGQFEGRGAGSKSVLAGLIPNVKLHLGNLTMLNQMFAAIPLDTLAFHDGRTIDGVLGYELFDRFVVEVNYASKHVTFHEAESFVYNGSGIVLPIQIHNRLPHVYARVVMPDQRSIKGLFEIDTGARTALILNAPFVNKHGLLTSNIKVISSPLGVGVGGQANGQIGRVRNLWLDKLQINEPVVGLYSGTDGAFASPDFDGIIGGEILRRFKVIFDYSRKRLILELNDDFKRPYDIDMSGLWLVGEGPDFRRFKVLKVIESSPAAEAKIQKGDIIVAVDDRPAREFTLEQIRKLLKEAGREVRLTIKRDSQTHLVILKLRRLI